VHRRLMGPGQDHPQSHDQSLVVAQNDVRLDAAGDRVDQRRAEDRERIRLDVPMGLIDRVGVIGIVLVDNLVELAYAGPRAF